MPAATTVSFATCNLYNINLPGLPIYRDADGWDQPSYDRKVAWMASALSTVDSDVWGFQELWHRDALQQVFKAAKRHTSYDLLIPPATTGRGIVCAGAVKKGMLVGDAQWITEFPDAFVLKSGGDDDQTCDIDVQIHSFSRPVLRFEIKPRSNGKRIAVFVAHLKSKLPTAVYRERSWYEKEIHSKHATALGSAISTIRRTAEAAALRWMITEVVKGTDNPVVVLGDLNDDQHSNTLNILTEQPGYLFGGSVGGADNGLYTVGTLQEYRSLRDVYYTHIHNNKRESLDHILVSQEFYDNSKKRLWRFVDMEIYNDHLNSENHKELGTTDHGIVKATFRYSKYRR